MDMQTNGQKNENNQKNFSVDIIIPVYHPDDKLGRLLTMLYSQTILPDKVILLQTQDFEGELLSLPDISGSNVTVIPINKKDFDHGGTRKYGATLSNSDILMFMTQDAVPADEYLIANLLKPFEDPLVAASYARQLSREKEDLLERYTRSFNYPKHSRIKTKEDIKELGIKTFFCSNVCAAYRNLVYKQMGGFVDKTIFNEDMILASAIISADYKIAYTAQAKVIHSHHYTYMQQFSRNFDLGVSHNQYVEVFHGVKSESEGIKLVTNILKLLIDRKKYYLIPELLISSGFKFIGYQMGKRYDLFSRDFIIRCSMNKSYWK